MNAISLEGVKAIKKDSRLQEVVDTNWIGLDGLIKLDVDLDGKVSVDEYLEDNGYLSIENYKYVQRQVYTISREVAVRQKHNMFSRSSKELCDFYRAALPDPNILAMDSGCLFFCRDADFVDILSKYFENEGGRHREESLSYADNILSDGARLAFLERAMVPSRGSSPSVRTEAIRQVKTLAEDDRVGFLRRALKDPYYHAKNVASYQIKHLPIEERESFLSYCLNEGASLDVVVAQVRYLKPEDRFAFIDHAMRAGLIRTALNELEFLSEGERFSLLEFAMGSEAIMNRTRAIANVKMLDPKKRFDILSQGMKDEDSYVRMSVLYQVDCLDIKGRFNILLMAAKDSDYHVVDVAHQIMKDILSKQKSG